MNFQNRVALIIGGGGGIGGATAVALGEAGADVVLSYLNSHTRAEELAEQIRAMGRRAITIATDATDRAQVQRLVSETVQYMGRLDVAIYTAGRDLIRPFLEEQLSDVQEILNMELRGALLMCREVLPRMVQQHSGKILIIGAESAKVGTRGLAISSAARGATLAFTKSLARELGPKGVQINYVCPGPIDTARIRSISANAAVASKTLEAMASRVPMGRVGQPEEVAQVIRFLVSDEASYVTGQALSVSGGMITQ